MLAICLVYSEQRKPGNIMVELFLHNKYILVFQFPCLSVSIDLSVMVIRTDWEKISYKEWSHIKNTLLET